MKTITLSLLVAVSLGAATIAAGRIEQKETLRRSFMPSLPSQVMNLSIDNMWGSITVRTHQSPSVDVVVDKTLSASSEEGAKAITEKVKLDVSQTGNDVRFYVDGPFRCRESGSRHRDWDFDAKLVCDFEVTVPANTRVNLKTVVDGDIAVTGLAGDFNVEVVTGKAELKSMAGSGRASSVVGGVTATFDRIPTETCYFRSVSGDIRVSFPKALSADLYFKTFHGEVFTDFPVSTLPPEPVKKEVKNGKSIYRFNDFFRVRVGRGGPELKFDTLTGNIEIHDREL